jgi:hypothetical protein
MYKGQIIAETNKVKLSDRACAYSLPDSFPVPADLVRVLLADGVGQRPVERPRPDDAREEIAELGVELVRGLGALGRQGRVHRGPEAPAVESQERAPGAA